jgi:hypothetical protein
VPVSFFFEEMSSEAASAGPLIGSGDPLTSDPEEFKRDPLAKRESLELVRAYYRITDPRVRKRVFELTKSIAVGQSKSD